MAIKPLGQLTVVPLREVWKHEERELTPWLATNIDQLSSILEVPIVVDHTEHRVGSYELDILGHVESSDTVVVVENQLTATDHGHLGQLVAYAAGLGAAIVVWVAAEMRDEHRTAIEWLNANMDESVSFFLVRPEAFSIDGSKAAVRLVLEAGPSEFSRRLRGIRKADDAPRHELRRQFWEALLLYLAEHGHAWARNRATTKGGWISSKVGRGGVSANVSFASGSRMRVEIYLGGERAKAQFDQLSSHRSSIEERLKGESVSWERLEDALAARVAVYRDIDKTTLLENTPKRESLFSWIDRNLSAFRAIATEFLVERVVT